MKIIKDAGNLKDKKILLRTDFDVPVSEKGEIQESFRIKKQKEQLDELLNQGARVVMVAHISAIPSFAELVPQLHILLGREFDFIKSVSEIGTWLNGSGQIALLDNVRQNDGEKKNDPDFAKELAAGFDIYVDNAFAVAHREHASVSAITKFLPSYAGALMEEEVMELQTIIDAPEVGKVIIMGGAKAETKVPVIKFLISKAQEVLLGGVVANDVLKEKGQDMGSSVVDEDFHQLLIGLDLNDKKLVAPKDFIVFDNKILDIGDETMGQYIETISQAKLVIWNGPLGLFENPAFAKGTNEIAKAIVSSSARSIVGGGDTIEAIDRAGLLDKFSFVSTGGGAMLAYLAGEKLPALAALG